MAIRAVVFDAGECLVDETREYGTWADWLGVPRHTFAAMFGAVITQGRDCRDVFQEFRPGFDLTEQREARAAAGKPEWFGEDDLCPDVRPAPAALRAAGLRLGIAGNQTVRAGGLLRDLFTTDVDLIGTSDDWGASKPDIALFERVADVVPYANDEILYVGDRVDNDLRPGAAAGTHTADPRRGFERATPHRPPGHNRRWGPGSNRTPSALSLCGIHEVPGRSSGRGSGQNCRAQESILPVSAPARSATRSFQTPLATSEEAFTVKVWTMSSALPPVRLRRL